MNQSSGILVCVCQSSRFENADTFGVNHKDHPFLVLDDLRLSVQYMPQQIKIDELDNNLINDCQKLHEKIDELYASKYERVRQKLKPLQQYLKVLLMFGQQEIQPIDSYRELDPDSVSQILQQVQAQDSPIQYFQTYVQNETDNLQNEVSDLYESQKKLVKQLTKFHVQNVNYNDEVIVYQKVYPRKIYLKSIFYYLFLATLIYQGYKHSEEIYNLDFTKIKSNLDIIILNNTSIFGSKAEEAPKTIDSAQLVEEFNNLRKQYKELININNNLKSTLQNLQQQGGHLVNIEEILQAAQLEDIQIQNDYQPTFISKDQQTYNTLMQQL